MLAARSWLLRLFVAPAFAALARLPVYTLTAVAAGQKEQNGPVEQQPAQRLEVLRLPLLNNALT
jgi:hypothetical protein